MPIGNYFKGEGSNVMADTKDLYGEDKGKQVFYATANKTGMRPGSKKNAKPPKRGTIGHRIDASKL